ncbi:dihydroorotase [Obesumbacterium proteus]|nr:dihydroorotase [Obesumbacterium proteus]
MEMPNVVPQTTDRLALQDKFARAAQVSLANHSFYLGATNNNLDEIRQLKPDEACGVKIFMGASTGNMLVDKEDTLAKIFADSPVLIATHCEDSPFIKEREKAYRLKYGNEVPAYEHAEIRNVEACYRSSSLAVSLAKKYGSRLHVLHITTAEELALFEAAPTLEHLKKKQITAEACVHHLFFNQLDHHRLGHLIKCNPSIKAQSHQVALWQALNDGVIDIIATDHAPHTWEEKKGHYFNVPSGLPLVQHALPALLDLCVRGVMTPELMVQKISHAVTERYQIKDRGYLREGYWADVVLIDPTERYNVRNNELFYQCGWTPFNDYVFNGGSIKQTWINGHCVYHNGAILPAPTGQRLTFNRQA